MVQNIIVGHAIHCSFIVVNMWHCGNKKTWRQHWEVGRGRLQDEKDSGCSCFQITTTEFKLLGVDSVTVSLFVLLYLIWQIRYYCETSRLVYVYAVFQGWIMGWILPQLALLSNDKFPLKRKHIEAHFRLQFHSKWNNGKGFIQIHGNLSLCIQHEIYTSSIGLAQMFREER